MKTRHRIPALLVGLLAGAPAFAAEAAGSLHEATRRHGFVIGRLAKAELEKERVKAAARLTFVSMSGHQGKLDLELELISPIGAEEAETLATQKLQMVAHLYREQKVPYPGEISNEVACGKESQPRSRERKVAGMKVRMLAGAVNERFAFGACQKESRRYLGLDSFFCLPGRQTLVELRAFRPWAGAKPAELFSLLEKLEVVP